jgi:hypothetical protein
VCDFFTIETVWLQTIYELFFIELRNSWDYLAGITPNPNEVWITQQARQIIWVFKPYERKKPLNSPNTNCEEV